jgi:predicted  nucleic acid-binding Zn-ribbon protein
MVVIQSMTRLTDLVRLQDVDLALDVRRTALADAESRVGESEELIALRERVEELRSTLHVASAAQKDVELEADGLKAKIAPVEEKLYSGAIKNPRELSDLQADIDQLKHQLSTVEDRDLAALAALETAQTEISAAEAELASMEQAWQAEQAELRTQVETLSAEIATHDAQRAEQAVAIDKELLAHYDHIRRAHQGRGVAKLDRNLCLGCRISLPVSTVNKARAGNTIAQCPNCERILYS